MHLFFLLLIPLFISFCFYFWSVNTNGHFKITLKEFLIQVAAITVIIVIGYFIAKHQSISDYEVWNAQVSNKYSQKVSCSHSYSCRCRRVSCGKGCSNTVCDTCYEHFYDIDWMVETTAGERFKISRVNRQGTEEPPRWSRVRMGDNTALIHSFDNFIKGNPGSLLNRYNEKPQYAIPEYPLNSYDYHYVDRFVTDRYLDNDFWNSDLQALNSELGVNKQVNIIVVVTKNPENFSYDLQNSWLGGKKNDVIVVIGSSSETKIDWVRVVSWSHSELMKVELRDSILQIGDLNNREEIISAIRHHVLSGFRRMEMADYQYLLEGITPSNTAMVILSVLGILVSFGLSWLFHNEDIA